MTRSARASLFLGALAAAVVFSVGLRIASAHAAGPPQPADLAAAITAYANSQVDAAMAEATAASSQVVQIQVPVPAPVPAAPDPPGDQSGPSPPAGDATQPAVGGDSVGGSVEITASVALPTAPIPPPVVVPAPSALSSALEGNSARHELWRLALRTKSADRASSTSISRSTSSLRVELQTSTTAPGASSSNSVRAVAHSTVRSNAQNSSSGGRSQRPAGPKAPLPIPPFAPNAPAPSSGASSAGGGGQGALITFSAVLAALVVLGIYFLLRRVHWSALRMPSRGAALPWKPG